MAEILYMLSMNVIELWSLRADGGKPIVCNWFLCMLAMALKLLRAPDGF